MSHFYDRDANLVECDIRRARKEGLYPSVTTILNIFDSYGLNQWKIRTAVATALENKKKKKETEEEYIERVVTLCEDTTGTYANIGTLIHKAIEDYLVNGTMFVSPDKQLEEMFMGAYSWLSHNVARKIAVEKCYVDDSIEAGCRIDLLSELKDGSTVLIDFKTQRFKNGKSKSYPEHRDQLAGQTMIIGSREKIDRWLNVYINASDDGFGNVDVKEWSADEIQQGIELFMYARHAYQLKKNLTYTRRENDN